MNIKIVVGIAVVALLGVVAYAWSQQGTPTITPTGSSLPPVITPAAGAAAPRARATGSGGARDVATPTKGATATSSRTSSTSHQNIRTGTRH